MGDSPRVHFGRIIPVILSGGSGTRLWPLSRADYPKQFLRLTGVLSLFQQTALRFAGSEGFAPPLMVCNEAHRFLAAEQLQEVGITSPAILLEPCGRNTAPALAAAALYIQEQYGPECLMLAMPSDHVIGDVTMLYALVEASTSAAQAGSLVAFGITPTHPATGYGYIKNGAPLGVGGMHAIAHFAEKPDAQTAQSYLDSGDYAWNSGMFFFACGSFLVELERLQPEIVAACRAAVAGRRSDLDFIRLEKTAFAACPALSIDYAVMEHTRSGAVIAMAQPWCDLGDWTSLWTITDKDKQGNAMVGTVHARDSRNCYLHSDGPAISALGVEDLVIVSTKDAVLVAHKNSAQEVKALVETLAGIYPAQVATHGRVYRPWGYYDTIDGGEQYQVKRITVRPGGQLSLQRHGQRAEHWVVVHGTARVEIDGVQRMLSANESVYIPCGTVHRIENTGTDNLHVVEVQTGEYLGEDDIVRLADKYGRTNEQA